MNKKGFTLVELLAVIIILGVVGVIAVAGIGNLAKNTKEEMLDKKITMIEEAAILYGEDNKGSIMVSSNNFRYNTYPCKNIYVNDLIPSYLSKDNDNNCIVCSTKNSSTGLCTRWNSSSTSAKGCIVDPSNDDNYLDKLKIIVYVKNKRVRATVAYGDNASISCSR